MVRYLGFSTWSVGNFFRFISTRESKKNILRPSKLTCDMNYCRFPKECQVASKYSKKIILHFTLLFKNLR